ncbi:hypothetical protein J4E80_008891 [Alternaria sp. BMP 0032]|nr:hypothetical protein J4E80_008891 [Alternaria sp. BMP 0032]
MINVQVGLEQVPFAVHVDLLCSSSGFFEKEFQSSRKVIEGECSICTEGMLDHSPITFCDDCGQNFHTKCIQGWLDREETCPLCRIDWAAEEDASKIGEYTWEKCDPLSFDMYMQWLYIGIIPSCPHGDADNAVQSRFTQLMKAHILGDKLQDPGFLKAIREEIVDYVTVKKLPEREVIVFAYANTSTTSLLRKFLANLYALRVSPRTPNFEVYPKQFLYDLLRASLGRRGPTTSLRKSLAHWLPKEEGTEDQEREELEANAV